MLSSDIQGKHFEGDILNLMLKYIIYLIKKKKRERGPDRWRAGEKLSETLDVVRKHTLICSRWKQQVPSSGEMRMGRRDNRDGRWKIV